MCSEVPKFSLSAEGGGPPITISAGNAKLRRQILSLTASISAMPFSYHKSAPGHKIFHASNLVGRLTQVTFFQVTWSRRLLPSSSVPQVLTVGDSAYIEDPRILIAKKPQDNVNSKFNLDYVGDQKTIAGM